MTMEASINSGFQEFHIPSSQEPLRQGGVLEATDAGASIWQRRLLVLTADCDFAHGKHQGRVTCVPILDSGDYLLHFQLPAMRTSYARKPLAELQAAVDKAGFKGASRERLIEWVREDSADDIIAGLDKAVSDAISLSNHIDALRILHEPHNSLAEGISAFATAVQKTGLAKSREDALARVRGDLRTRFNALPGDAMFLNAVAPGSSDGYCAYLRHIEQVWESDIAVAPTRSSVTHRRLARLRDRFTDAIAQQFGMVFMSIGLPTAYEHGRRRHAERLGEGGC